MKVKMVDVARRLGISKATVSLAINGKPGVNEQTRQRIFRCIEEMEASAEEEKDSSQMEEPVRSGTALPSRIIKVVIINHRKQVVCDPELDLWSGVLRTFDTEARRMGYLYGLTYLNEIKEEQDEIIRECNMDMVAGIILFGTEMSALDYKVIRQIHKPMVIYDYDMPDVSYSSVCIDNYKAVEMALDMLEKRGTSEIQYFRTGKDIYNFQMRREAFQDIREKRGHLVKKSDVISLGNTIEEITEQAASYLSVHKLPDAFVLENYQVSIGVLAAVRRLGISVPGKLKLIGIDEIPAYVATDTKLTQIQIPHEERAAMAMGLLDREITSSWDVKVRVFAVPKLIEGASV